MKGLILAGGESSRLGSDKSLLTFHTIPQREYLFGLLSEFCTDVYLSCKHANGIPPHLNPLADKYDFRSPLNGILSALESSSSDSWLTVPVDMPAINGDVISFLIAHRDTSCAATCFYDSDNANPEPLLAIWEPGVLPALKSFQLAGRKSPRDFLNTQKIKLLKSPSPALHININTKEDLDGYKQG
jgi:molybdenum cofactor guanylyltransferase